MATDYSTVAMTTIIHAGVHNYYVYYLLNAVNLLNNNINLVINIFRNLNIMEPTYSDFGLSRIQVLYLVDVTV